MKKGTKTLALAISLPILLTLLICHSSIAQTASATREPRVLLLEGQYEQAIVLLQKTLVQDSLNSKAWYSLGMAYQAELQHQEAVSALRKALALDSGNRTIAYTLGKSYAFLGRDEQAGKLFQHLFDQDSSDIAAAVQLGEIYRERGEFQNGREIYRFLAHRDSTNAWYLRQRGFCEEQCGDTTAAMVSFRKSFQINPYDIRTALQLSRLYLQGKQPDSALRVVDTCLGLHPRHTGLAVRKGDILFDQKKYREAQKEFSFAAEMGDSSGRTLRKLGRSCFFSGDYLKTRAVLEQAARRDSSEATMYFYLGVACRELGDFPASVKYLREAIKLSIPEYLSDFYTQLAAGYESSQQFPQALHAYKKALDLEPKRKELLFYVASVYDQFYKDRKVPLFYYRKFLETGKNADDRLLDYAEDRIRQLTAELHFHHD